MMLQEIERCFFYRAELRRLVSVLYQQAEPYQALIMISSLRIIAAALARKIEVRVISELDTSVVLTVVVSYWNFNSLESVRLNIHSSR